MVFSVVLFLAFFGVENGSASQTVRAMRLLYVTLVNDHYPAVVENKPFLYYYYIGETTPNVYDAFPFLASMKYNPSGAPSYLQDWVPYGSFPYSNGSYKYPYFYRLYSTIVAGTIPDDWTQDDVDDINEAYNKLSGPQKMALPGTIVCGNSTQGGITSKFIQFNKATPGTVAYSNGVYTYDQNGDIVVSFPDGTGYASGYKPLPDGTYTPVYYSIEDGSVVEYNDITPTVYDSLTYDTDTGNYSLQIPNYSKQLDKIINKIDHIDLSVSSPEVIVNPTVTVTPDVTVNVDSPSLSDIEESLVNIGNVLVDSPSDSLPDVTTNDFVLTSEEQDIISSFRSWQTDIPLIGSAADFGLTALFGRIPEIGKEMVWADFYIGSSPSRDGFKSAFSLNPSRDGSKSASPVNPLRGFHVRIDISPYQGFFLAFRGWIIIAEAIFTLFAIYRNVREALQV